MALAIAPGVPGLLQQACLAQGVGEIGEVDCCVDAARARVAVAEKLLDQQHGHTSACELGAVRVA